MVIFEADPAVAPAIAYPSDKGRLVLRARV
jgi:hypothetical protein